MQRATESNTLKERKTIPRQAWEAVERRNPRLWNSSRRFYATGEIIRWCHDQRVQPQQPRTSTTSSINSLTLRYNRVASYEIQPACTANNSGSLNTRGRGGEAGGGGCRSNPSAIHGATGRLIPDVTRYDIIKLLFGEFIARDRQRICGARAQFQTRIDR